MIYTYIFYICCFLQWIFNIKEGVMKESYLIYLSHPLTLLFLFTSLVLIVLSAYLWNIFLNLKHTKIILSSPEFADNYPLAFRLCFLLPVLAFALIAQYFWSISGGFFPGSVMSAKSGLINSLIGIIALHGIKYLDRKSLPSMNKIYFYLYYLWLLYIFYLIILLATVVIRLNAFPDNFLYSYSSINAEKLNYYLMYALFALNWVVLCIAVSVRIQWRILLFVLYSLITSLMNYFFQYGG